MNTAAKILMLKAEILITTLQLPWILNIKSLEFYFFNIIVIQNPSNLITLTQRAMSTTGYSVMSSLAETTKRLWQSVKKAISSGLKKRLN
ncbi:hypothetical protein ANSO36C_26060 [Nostoc cf. commune SO-36]|uniref:Uncharacterized protein n=1 Tax=Nostoc cf. commune SO-36 TaxID=449208 RepID=A0ABM7Z1H3_NOSCO|nr:hypothetical protein ANSO36C_26060 [Nostoc cf. commune SO-36]